MVSRTLTTEIVEYKGIHLRITYPADASRVAIAFHDPQGTDSNLPHVAIGNDVGEALARLIQHYKSHAPDIAHKLTAFLYACYQNLLEQELASHDLTQIPDDAIVRI